VRRRIGRRRSSRCVDGWMDGWMDAGWMDGWVGGWMDGLAFSASKGLLGFFTLEPRALLLEEENPGGVPVLIGLAVRQTPTETEIAPPTHTSTHLYLRTDSDDDPPLTIDSACLLLGRLFLLAACILQCFLLPATL